MVNVNSTNTTLSYYNYQFDGVGDRASLWDNGVDVSNWNYDCSGQLKNDVYRPATTALNWNGLTVDHVPTKVAISLRRDEPYAMHVVLPKPAANFTQRG